jgi:hypothetical protein
VGLAAVFQRAIQKGVVRAHTTAGTCKELARPSSPLKPRVLERTVEGTCEVTLLDQGTLCFSRYTDVQYVPTGLFTHNSTDSKTLRCNSKSDLVRSAGPGPPSCWKTCGAPAASKMPGGGKAVGRTGALLLYVLVVRGRGDRGMLTAVGYGASLGTKYFLPCRFLVSALTIQITRRYRNSSSRTQL